MTTKAEAGGTGTSTSQGMPRVTSRHQKFHGDRKDSVPALRGAWPCQQLAAPGAPGPDSETSFPPSSPRPALFCHSSPGCCPVATPQLVSVCACRLVTPTSWVPLWKCPLSAFWVLRGLTLRHFPSLRLLQGVAVRRPTEGGPSAVRKLGAQHLREPAVRSARIWGTHRLS